MLQIVRGESYSFSHPHIVQRFRSIGIIAWPASQPRLEFQILDERYALDNRATVSSMLVNPLSGSLAWTWNKGRVLILPAVTHSFSVGQVLIEYTRASIQLSHQRKQLLSVDLSNGAPKYSLPGLVQACGALEVLCDELNERIRSESQPRSAQPEWSY